jgi:predicted AlkP superfamily phosphohydrolase/phosphomutase
MSSSAPAKAVTVGLDGATFGLLDPLIAAGVMPNLEQILARGVRARLMSTIPPVTAPAWTTFTTGVNPGRHGVFDFRQRLDGKLRWVTSHSVRAPRIWDWINVAGHSAGAINMPLTYPPTPVREYMLSGFLTPSNSREYTYPPGLGEQLERAIGEYIIYEPIPPMGLREKEDIAAYLHRIQRMVHQRARALYWFMSNHPTDLLVIVFQVLDTLQHVFWKYLDPREPAFNSELATAVRPALLDCYRQVDDILGQVQRRLDDNTYFILGSDHGFGPLSHQFLVNEWLAQQGLLRYSRGKLVAEKVIRRVRNHLRLGKAGAPLLEQTTRFVPDHKSAIDWARTQAFSGEIHQQAIYVNLRGREPMGIVEPGEKYEAVRDEVIAQASKLRDPTTGQRIHCQVHRREELYHGPFVEDAPDLAIVADDYNYQATTLFSLRGRYLQDQHLPLGAHRRDGILVISGPGVRPGDQVAPVSIADVTPTVLYLMGLAVPEGLDGNVIVEALDPGYLQNHPVRYQPATQVPGAAEGISYSESEAAEIETRLQGLGYLE